MGKKHDLQTTGQAQGTWMELGAHRATLSSLQTPAQGVWHTLITSQAEAQGSQHVQGLHG